MSFSSAPVAVVHQEEGNWQWRSEHLCSLELVSCPKPFHKLLSCEFLDRRRKAGYQDCFRFHAFDEDLLDNLGLRDERRLRRCAQQDVIDIHGGQ